MRLVKVTGGHSAEVRNDGEPVQRASEFVAAPDRIGQVLVPGHSLIKRGLERILSVEELGEPSHSSALHEVMQRVVRQGAAVSAVHSLHEARHKVIPPVASVPLVQPERCEVGPRSSH